MNRGPLDLEAPSLLTKAATGSLTTICGPATSRGGHSATLNECGLLAHCACYSLASPSPGLCAVEQVQSTLSMGCLGHFGPLYLLLRCCPECADTCLGSVVGMDAQTWLTPGCTGGVGGTKLQCVFWRVCHNLVTKYSCVFSVDGP